MNYFSDFICKNSKLKEDFDDLFPNSGIVKDGYVDKLSEISFSKNQYLQSSSEVLYSMHFVNNNFIVTNDFKFEGLKKDVDIKTYNEEIRMYLEVKTPEVIEKDKDTIYASTGQYRYSNDKEESLKVFKPAFDDIKVKLESSGQKVEESKKDDNKLKDYLESAQSKMKYPSRNEVNILLICMDTDTLTKFFYYIVNPLTGLFSDNPYIDPVVYDKVDFIVLSNSIEGQFEFGFKFNNWNAKNYMHFIIPNVQRLNAGSICSEAANQLFSSLKDQYIELVKYRESKCYIDKLQSKGIHDMADELLMSDFIATRFPQFNLNKQNRNFE